MASPEEPNTDGLSVEQVVLAEAFGVDPLAPEARIPSGIAMMILPKLVLGMGQRIPTADEQAQRDLLS